MKRVLRFHRWDLLVHLGPHRNWGPDEPIGSPSGHRVAPQGLCSVKKRPTARSGKPSWPLPGDRPCLDGAAGLNHILARISG
jgi:hypothetical protein